MRHGQPDRLGYGNYFGAASVRSWILKASSPSGSRSLDTLFPRVMSTPLLSLEETVCSGGIQQSAAVVRGMVTGLPDGAPTETLALLTYRSAHVADGGTLERHARRASLWQSSGQGWQLRFHQGALVAALKASDLTIEGSGVARRSAHVPADNLHTQRR